MLVHIYRSGDRILITSKYDPDVVSVCKTFGARWDPNRKQWWLDPDIGDVHGLTSALTAHGHTVSTDLTPAGDPAELARLRRELAAARRELAAVKTATSADQLRGFLATFGLPGYRALSKVAHPDAGGDVEWMQRINRAWDDLGRKGA